MCSALPFMMVSQSGLATALCNCLCGSHLAHHELHIGSQARAASYSPPGQLCALAMCVFSMGAVLKRPDDGSTSLL